MDEPTISALSADILGLAPWAGKALATRPKPESLPGMVIPAAIGDVPRPFPEPADEERDELVEALEAGLTRLEPHVAVLDSVRSLRRPGACLVLAGQQPGLLGGPLYNIYKAVHAIRLAAALEEAWGVPVKPAFWNHGDDHDIAEVHHLWVRNRNLDLFKVGLAGMSSGRVPLSRVHFNAKEHRLGALREVLRQNLADNDRARELIDRFLPRDGMSFARAFTHVLLELFGNRGLIVLEPDWIRPQLSRSLVHVVTSDVADSLAEGSRRLREVGVEPAIDPSTAALVFHHEDGKRRALRIAPDTPASFRYDGEPGSRTAAELAAEIVDAPADWSAGALLRPLVQDHTLPVACYVGGWGELAYHAQLPPLRQAANIPRTAFVPRLSATLVDSATARSLDTLGLTVGEVLKARGRVTVEAAETPKSRVAERLREIARATKRDLLAERADLSELDRGLATQIKKVADQSVAGIEKLAAKADRVAANSAGRGRRHYRRIETSLFPREQPQERVQGILEALARHGTSWIEFLEAAIEPLPTEHFVLHLPDSEDIP